MEFCECADCVNKTQPPLAMILFCPSCGTKHVDKGEWATKKHKKHLCETCSFEWQPSLINTVGVEALER